MLLDFMSWGSEGRCQTDLAPPFMRGPANRHQEKGRGSRDNLHGRGCWRGPGGVTFDKKSEIPPGYYGQLVCDIACLSLGYELNDNVGATWDALTRRLSQGGFS